MDVFIQTSTLDQELTSQLKSSCRKLIHKLLHSCHFWESMEITKDLHCRVGESIHLLSSTTKFPRQTLEREKNSIQSPFYNYPTPGTSLSPGFSFTMLQKQFLVGQFPPTRIQKMTEKKLTKLVEPVERQRTPSSNVVISESSYHVVRQPEESISILHTEQDGH